MGSRPKKWTLKNFPQVFTKFFLRFLKKLPERACCQREPAARESLLPERVCCQRARECQDVPKSAGKSAKKCQGSDESATECQKVAAEGQREPGWTPKDFPQVFPKFFPEVFGRLPESARESLKTAARESQDVPQSARKCRRVPERAAECQREPGVTDESQTLRECSLNFGP